MASIGTTFPTQSSNSALGSTGSSSSSASSATADPLANESTFLQLLVSQLKNQNPMNPMDGTTFVTQLAQFSDLEQNLAMRQDLDTLTTKYAPTTSSSSNGQSSSGTDAAASADGSNNDSNATAAAVQQLASSL